MSRKAAPSLTEYIWENYPQLIERETNYRSKMRALLFKGNRVLSDEESVYLSWPREQLEREVNRLELEREPIAMAVAEKYAATIAFNRCPKCSALTISPRSERCVACSYTWYGSNPLRSSVAC